MKWLAPLAIITLTAPAMAESQPPLPWVLTTETYTTTVQTRILTNAPINLITGTQPGSASPPRGPQTPGVWNRVDLKPWGIAADAKWAELTGLLIITHGSTAETANLTVTFRRPGDNDSNCANYIGQTIEAAIGSGQRSTVTATTPLINGEFEWCYTKSTSGAWPTNSAYGINMVVSKWGR